MGTKFMSSPVLSSTHMLDVVPAVLCMGWTSRRQQQKKSIQFPFTLFWITQPPGGVRPSLKKMPGQGSKTQAEVLAGGNALEVEPGLHPCRFNIAKALGERPRDQILGITYPLACQGGLNPFIFKGSLPEPKTETPCYYGHSQGVGERWFCTWGRGGPDPPTSGTRASGGPELPPWSQKNFFSGASRQGTQVSGVFFQKSVAKMRWGPFFKDPSKFSGKLFVQWRRGVPTPPPLTPCL